MSIQTEALFRAQSGDSVSNFPAIFEGFESMGISDIKPRENIFTYQAWLAKGRQVRKGQHGVKVQTWVTGKDKKTGEEKRYPKRTTVFHVSQTDLIQ